MSIPTLEQAKTYTRQIDNDLDAVIAIAIAAAQAELDTFIGGDPSATRWPTEDAVPGDVLAAALVLTALHFDGGDALDVERRRGAAQALLNRYRTDSGMRAA